MHCDATDARSPQPLRFLPDTPMLAQLVVPVGEHLWHCEAISDEAAGNASCPSAVLRAHALKSQRSSTARSPCSCILRWATQSSGCCVHGRREVRSASARVAGRAVFQRSVVVHRRGKRADGEAAQDFPKHMVPHPASQGISCGGPARSRLKAARVWRDVGPRLRSGAPQPRPIRGCAKLTACRQCDRDIRRSG